jgi:hypothetical protein
VYAGLELAGAEADVQALEAGLSANELMGRELWLDGVPPPIQSEWSKLESALLKADEDWDIWTKWYLERLKGQPPSEQSEVGRVKLPLDIWAQGPRIVNAYIKQRIQEDEARRPIP